MISWAQMCVHHTDNYCGMKPDPHLCVRFEGVVHCTTNVSALTRRRISIETAFYTAREHLLSNMHRSSGLPPVDLSHSNLPQRLEFLLDDNYATRMLCGGAVHEQEKRIGGVELRCAERSLANHYSFIGLLERPSESLCLLSKQMGMRPRELRLVEKKMQHYRVPPEFELAHGAKYAMDVQLYRFAVGRFHRQLDEHPECRASRVGAEGAGIAVGSAASDGSMANWLRSMSRSVVSAANAPLAAAASPPPPLVLL